MKLMSYNIRGLGKKIKRSELKNLIKDHRIDVCCIQETKIEKIESWMCRAIWGNNNFDWAYKESADLSGGMLIIWNDLLFCKVSSWHMNGLLIVNGFFEER